MAVFLLLLSHWRSVVLVVFLGWIANKVFREWRSPLRKVPGPPGLPFVGQMFVFLTEKDHTKVLRDWSKTHGPILTYTPGTGQKRIFITDAAFVKQVLVTNSHKYQRSPKLKQVIPNMGNGLFSSNGKEHARQRRMISPAFHKDSLQIMLPVFEKMANNLVKVWNNKLNESSCKSVEVSVHEDLTHLTLDIIGQCSFGYQFNTVLSGDSRVSKAFSTMLHGLNFQHLLCKNWIPFYEHLPLPYNKKVKASQELVNNTVLQVIHEKQGRLQLNSSKKDLLDILMNMRDDQTDYAMDDEDLRSQVFTFMLAGHETTSVAMAWILYELAKRPECEQKARQEIESVFREHSQFTSAVVGNLTYLGSVIKEALRLHPPAAIFHRVAVQDDRIGDFDIPKGSLVTIGVDAIHHSENYWKEPFIFNPDRFGEEGELAVQPYAFLPFSGGPRTCIGSKFAFMEMKVVLAVLLKHFTFSTVSGLNIRPLLRLTLRPDPPLRLRISQLC